MPDLIRTVLIYGCLSQCPIFSASSNTRRCMQPASALRQGHQFTSVGLLHWRGKRRRQPKWEVWSPLTQPRKQILLPVINRAAHTGAGVPGWRAGACTFIKVSYSGLLPPSSLVTWRNLLGWGQEVILAAHYLKPARPWAAASESSVNGAKLRVAHFCEVIYCCCSLGTELRPSNSFFLRLQAGLEEVPAARARLMPFSLSNSTPRSWKKCPCEDI